MANEQPPRNRPLERRPEQRKAGSGHTETQATELLISNPWTRSPGRLRFRTMVQHSLTLGGSKQDYLFAVLYVDLDRFKLVNASLGRELADQLLQEVARRLRDCLRTGDIITRLREDEYLIFLDDVQHVSGVLDFAERLREVLRPAFRIGGQEVFVSATAGIALGPRGYTKAEDIVRDAETAMHGAKLNGPGSYGVFDSKLHEEAKRQLKLETQLRGAIDFNQLRLQYEPIVSISDNRVAGFEALVRWQHPERGLVPPGEFVPIAERTGLIIPITQWVLREACRTLQLWQSRPAGLSFNWLTVNLSPAYIEKSNFADEVAHYVEETMVDASNLVLEITENQLLENAEHILTGFGKLHDTGIKLWIDDFGSGYSSLSYLVKFPIHTLKIDRSFISKIGSDSKSLAITKAIVALGETLGVNVVAEGIETPEQLECLRQIGCQYAQGHYFSGAIETRSVEQFLERRNSDADRPQ